MNKKSKAEDRLNSARIRDHIGHLLKKHYQACTTAELPSRLFALLKKLDEEQPELSLPNVTRQNRAVVRS